MIEQLQFIIDEYKNGENRPLDGDEVDVLCDLIKVEINLNEGNITQEEYNILIEEIKCNHFQF